MMSGRTRQETGDTMGGERLVCPLCGGSDPVAYHEDRWRSYHQCRVCALVFVPPAAWPDRAAERARYDEHRNDVDDPGYRAFVSRLADPLLARMPPEATVLDFGCGPGPALARVLEEAGHRVSLYDPHYRPDDSVWRRRYHAIVGCEVIEHVHTPASVLDRLFGHLEPGGWLGIMTRWMDRRDSFVDSRYIRDPTHVAFYSPATFEWIADRWTTRLELPARDVALLQPTRATAST